MSPRVYEAEQKQEKCACSVACQSQVHNVESPPPRTGVFPRILWHFHQYSYSAAKSDSSQKCSSLLLWFWKWASGQRDTSKQGSSAPRLSCGTDIFACIRRIFNGMNAKFADAHTPTRAIDKILWQGALSPPLPSPGIATEFPSISDTFSSSPRLWGPPSQLTGLLPQGMKLTSSRVKNGAIPPLIEHRGHFTVSQNEGNNLVWSYSNCVLLGVHTWLQSTLWEVEGGCFRW
jgi:hypothetical protein